MTLQADLCTYGQGYNNIPAFSPKSAGITTANSFLLKIAEHENIFANKYENAKSSWYFHIH